MKVYLNDVYFTHKEVRLLELDNLKASVFQYKSGIKAIRIENSLGFITVLPYSGQMIWDAVFHGRSLKMQTPFEIPVVADVFGQTYGCYLMHCGMSSMGVPKATDSHPVHGHLPYASMKDAYLKLGNDEKGKYIELFSSYERNIAFDEHYLATPSVRIYENSSVLKINIHVQNLSRKKMSLMYLCHINNRIVPDAKILQTLKWDKNHMAIQDLPTDADKTLTNLHGRIREEPAASNPISENEYYDPEVCFFLRDMNQDENGNSHFLHVLPDGSSDYTCFDSNVLKHGVRWIAYHENCKAMGMILPGTAESEGFTKETQKGNVRYLEPKESFEATVYCGGLDKEDTRKVAQKIQQINS